MGTCAFVALIAAVYAPVLWDAMRAWFEDADLYGHGFIVVAIAAGLLWSERNAFAQARFAPVRVGLLYLTVGFAMESAGWLLGIRFLSFASLVPVLAGAILALHGRDAWRIARFPVCFLLFAATWPGVLLAPISNWIQAASATVAGVIVRVLQVPVIQTGNIFVLPNARLEVADVCSGFKKLIALIAIAAWYGHAYGLRPFKHVALASAAIPVALAANALRVAALIVIAYAGGEGTMKSAHNASEMFVLVLAYIMFVLIGKALGCEKLEHCA
jgi:exosortase